MTSRAELRQRIPPPTLAHIEAIRHIDFTGLGFASVAVSGLTGAAPPDLPEQRRAYAALTLAFLQQPGRVVVSGAPSPPWMHAKRYSLRTTGTLMVRSAETEWLIT